MERAEPLVAGAADGPPEAQDGLRLVVPNDRAALDAARQAVLDYLAPFAPSAQAIFKVEVVLEETLMNAVWHAFGGESGHVVELTVRVDDGRILLRFEDDGVPFDPRQAPPPTRPASLDAAVPGGLGLMLVRHLAASLDYERSGGRNRLTVSLARA